MGEDAVESVFNTPPAASAVSASVWVKLGNVSAPLVVVCGFEPLLEPDEDPGLGFPPVGLSLPPVGLIKVNPLPSGTVGVLVGSFVDPSSEDIGDLVTESSPEDTGAFVTLKTESKMGVAFSAGDFDGSAVILMDGDGDGFLLLSLQSGDQIAFSLQYADPPPQNP